MPARGDDAVWALVMFDLPVKKKHQQRAATQFRNFLLDEGFSMLQYSVYAIYLPSSARLTSIANDLRRAMPLEGKVRLLTVTDNQWSRAICFVKNTEYRDEGTPQQLLIF